MKSTNKRLLSILLCLAMVLAVLPMAVSAETATTIYVQPNENWLQSDARFAAYFFGNGEVWLDCTDADGDGNYEVAVPDGFTQVIFCRMDPATTENSWANKWNQTIDLTVPTDDNVVYVVDGWDNGAGQWIELGGEPEPVVYDYYVAGSEGLCGVEWDPAQNQMTYNEETGLYEITLDVWTAGTYEYKITTGSWDTPSYGYGEGNYTVVVKNPGDVTITFNAETTEVTCDVYEYGEAHLKFQLNADASADDASVDLRMITYVETLDFSMVQFKITINGEAAWVDCEVVYESINVSGTAMTANDIFGREGYLVTFTMTDIPAEFYGTDIQVQAEYHPLEGTLYGSSVRTIVLSDMLG